jgi:flagellar motor protein MotB
LGQGARTESGSARGEGFGEWWAAIAIISLATVAIVSLSGSAEPEALFVADPTPAILASLAPAERSLTSVESAFASLCREPVLLALELEPDCETGVITLPDRLFGGPGNSLGPEARQDVGAAMTTYLNRMRRLPAIWETLEGIEVRGHTDPTAVRNAYSTNIVGSQQRALGVLLFLMGPDGLSEADRDDLERLAIVSGVAFSRPPATCPEQTRDCYEEWRRVEIRPVLSESLRRGDWSRTIEEIRVAAQRAQDAAAASPR